MKRHRSRSSSRSLNGPEDPRVTGGEGRRLGRGSEGRASQGMREPAGPAGPALHPGDPQPGCPPNPSGTWECSFWSRKLFSPTGREHISNSMLNVNQKIAYFGIRCVFLISRDSDNLMSSSGCRWDCGGASISSFNSSPREQILSNLKRLSRAPGRVRANVCHVWETFPRVTHEPLISTCPYSSASVTRHPHHWRDGLQSRRARGQQEVLTDEGRPMIYSDKRKVRSD